MDQDYTILASKIKKLEEIARGGFGVVYKGLMQGRIEIAIKELYNQSLSEIAKQDLEQELAISQKMRHPNIVLLYGYCPQPLCLVMEYLPLSLYQLIHSKKEIPWELRYNISLDIVLGLEYMHSKNIIHRDLKSNNILLDIQMRAKITDFGLSRIRTESKSLESKSQVGNFRWMAPELMNMKPKYSKQSDIFALGVIFWEIAARKVPHSQVDDLSVREGIKSGEREEMPQNCPSEYQNIIDKCWQQNPTERATLETIQNLLDNLLKQSQIQASQQNTIEENIQSNVGNFILQAPQESKMLKQTQESQVFNQTQEFKTFNQMQENNIFNQAQESKILKQTQESQIFNQTQEFKTFNQIQENNIFNQAQESKILKQTQESQIFNQTQEFKEFPQI